MANSVYSINKGINKPIEFKGLKAQYIWYMAGCLVVLLVLFAILYIAGVNAFVCIGVVVAGGGFVISYVFKLSRTYGEHGLMKALARKQIPLVVKGRSRRIFLPTKRKR